MRKRIAGLTCSLALALVGPPAAATTTHGNYVGPDFTFQNIQETSTFGDPEPACCFGPPTGTGNQLEFTPAAFQASASGTNGLDQTGAQLQAMIVGNTPLDIIEVLLIEEFGQVTLSGPTGTGTTRASVSVSGFVTVLETTSGAISPVIIGFSGTYSPSQEYSLPGDAGTTPWSASVVVDVAAAVANATKVQLSFDNDLSAFSELALNEATITKDGVTVTVPEPASAALLGLGLVALGVVQARRSRS